MRKKKKKRDCKQILVLDMRFWTINPPGKIKKIKFLNQIQRKTSGEATDC
jgi:hypothetical protein